MDNISVLKLMVKHYEERGGGHSQKEALNEAISLAKDYEQAKSGLPEEKVFIDEVFQPSIDAVDSYNQALREVALGRMKFKERLPEIIRKTAHCSISTVPFGEVESQVSILTNEDEIAQAIMKELEK